MTAAEEKKILRQLAADLKAGAWYCTTHKNGMTVCNLRYDYGTSSVNGKSKEVPLWFWEHYGRSANRATLNDLNWIVRTIFQMKPSEFVSKYEKHGKVAAK